MKPFSVLLKAVVSQNGYGLVLYSSVLMPVNLKGPGLVFIYACEVHPSLPLAAQDMLGLLFNWSGEERGHVLLLACGAGVAFFVTSVNGTF